MEKKKSRNSNTTKYWKRRKIEVVIRLSIGEEVIRLSIGEEVIRLSIGKEDSNVSALK